MVTALAMGFGNGFGTDVGGGFDGVEVAPVLLELVKMILGGGAVNVLGVAAVVCGFPGRCGRLELYHRSASGCVLNFLNLAPGNPWTCD